MPFPIIDSARELLLRYDIIVSDVWGVVHDGVCANGPTCEALRHAREEGVTVVLLSNFPGSGAMAAELLDQKGVPRASWDRIVTSGDITRAHIVETGVSRVYHIGTQYDRGIYEGLPVELVAADRAEMVVATELHDYWNETPEDYRPLLAGLRARNLPFLCGNPDYVVHVGEHLLPCAGALALIYEELGGEVYWAGKPYRPAFEAALKAADAARGLPRAGARLLMIGDTVRTDLAGAQASGLDALFVVGGVHRDETILPDGRIDVARVKALCVEAGLRPVAAMAELVW